MRKVRPQRTRGSYPASDKQKEVIKELVFNAENRWDFSRLSFRDAKAIIRERVK